MVYRPYSFDLGLWEIPFPAISGAEAVKFEHKSLKVVEMAGFVGCWSEEELLRALLKNGPLIEKVVNSIQTLCSTFALHSSAPYSIHRHMITMNFLVLDLSIVQEKFRHACR